LIPRSQYWYPGFDGRYNAGKHYWTFPSGARIYFGHLQHEHDKHRYQGAQFTYIAFDELTEFTQSQYIYLFTRNRTTIGSGLRTYVRAATNPGQEGHEWVKRRFITTDIVNRWNWFAMVKNEKGDELDTRVMPNHPDAKSRAFYPAVLADNPSLDTAYVRNIRLNPDAVERAQLLYGDWDAINTEGRIFPNWTLENISTEADYDPNLPVIWGVDDGYAHGQGRGSSGYHPRVFLLAQVTGIGGVNIFAEYYQTNELSEDSLKNVRAWPYPDPPVAYVDSSAAELKGRIWATGIQTVGATHKVSEGIKNVRRMICDAQGKRLLRIHPRCVELIREMELYRYDERSKVAQIGEPKPLKQDDHGPDTIRYLAWHLRYVS